MVISSRTNEKIKAARALELAKHRRETGLHLVEGDKCVLDLLSLGIVPESIFALEDCGAMLPADLPVTYVTSEVMAALCTLKTPQKLAAVVKTPDCSCPTLYPSGLIVVLERVQDSGNVGTIIRCADALGASAVLLSPDCADPFSPKVVRASMGSYLHLPLYIGELAGELNRLVSQGFLCVCGDLKGEEVLPPRQEKTALVIGNEGRGISLEVMERCVRYRMPMRGKAESLNAAMFACILMDRLLRN